MEAHEYKQLENLLGKLGNELGKDYCIVPNCIQDGYHIAVYGKDGNPEKEATNYCIEATVAQLKGLPVKKKWFGLSI